MSTASFNQRCSKVAGEHCRLHNPAPPTKKFTNVEDVFKKVATISQNRTKAIKAAPNNQVIFQNFNETRHLPENIPASLEEHAEQSLTNLNHLTDEQKIALTGYTGFAAGVCNNILQGKDYVYYDEAPLWKETEGPCDFVNREELVGYMETMDDVLSNRSEETKIVYRGTPIYKSLHDEIGASIGKNLHINDTEGLVEGLRKYYEPGKTFNYKTYLSTSHSAHYAAGRTNNSHDTKQDYYVPKPEIMGIMFEMKTNAGLDVTGLARKQHAVEREVVLPRDTHFKVTNVYVKPQTYDTKSGYDNFRKTDEFSEKTYQNLAVVVQMVEVDINGNEITHTKNHTPATSIERIVPIS